MKYLVIISYIAMILVNALANIIPLGGVTTGEVSNAYPNLFTPAPLTFSIWGLIYLLLAVFVVYQFKNESDALQSIRKAFIASSIANMLWLTAWHMQEIGASLIVMVGLLLSLIWIAILRRKSTSPFLSVQLPFGVYFGWITVATIANVTVFLVQLGFDGFGISEDRWTAIVLLVGLVIAVRTMTKFRDIPYGLVILWAYAGILMKHLAQWGYAGMYMRVILVCIFSMFVLLLFIYKVVYDDFLKDKI